MGPSQPMQQVQQMSVCCEMCGYNHTSDMCPTNPESIYYVGQQSRGPMNQHAQYGNTYNANWRNHPNFSWGGNQSNQNQYRPQGNFNQPQRPPQQAEESTNDLLKKLLQDNQQLRTDFRNLERQMGQLAANQNTRPAGAFPGDTEKNPQVSAITGSFNPFEPLNMPDGPPLKPSVEEAPKLELKTLPSHLHYAYLGSSETLPIIISADLPELQEEKLLRVLREHKRAIGWTMSDIRGIVFPISDSKWVLARCEETNLVLNWEKCHFMEFDLEIRDRKGIENQVADHLSRMENRGHVTEGESIKKTFPDEHLLAITSDETSWYADYVNFIARKLKSRWAGPFVVVSVTPHGTVELRDTNSSGTFLV
ncbi:uncharacterized protein [Nicotiana sylvestris]|uniref:uncharacterized protein n=1 Tax=Nicotiana sylvestris TaxID=4096 RepID=UPI00388C740A